MFELVENNFVATGICKYKDEFGNRVLIRRTGNASFTAKLRFCTSGIVAKPLAVDVEKNTVGQSLHLDYNNSALLGEPCVHNAIEAFTTLVQHWFDMFTDMLFVWGDNKMLKRLNPEASDEDVCRHKLSLLEQYEEISGTLGAIFKE